MNDVELRQIGPYAVTELLRTSLTSNFYLGISKKKPVIIKRLNLPLTSYESKENFLTRGKQLKKLKNRNIVSTQEVGFDSDYGFLVMEHFSGETLRQIVPQGKRLAPDEVKRYLSPLAAALHYAHVNHILHGNLHPGNILFTRQKDLLLTEFTLQLPELPITIDDEEFTIPYMAPEQLHGEPTASSDQYSLAVIAYEWLCGRRPYDASQRALLQQQQQDTPITPLHTFNDAVSSAVEQVILQALSYKPEERFAHTQAFADHYLSALMGFAVRSTTSGLSLPGHQKTAPLAPVVPAQKETAPLPVPPPTDSAPKKTQLEEEPQPVRYVRAQNAPSKKVAEERSEPIHQTPQVPPPLPNAQKMSSQPVFNETRLQAVVSEDLRQGGILSQSLPGYEERSAQIEMAGLVAHALAQRTPAIIEASTGTGKSLAYLVPIVRSGKVAIISTANKALQEQLFYKDIPFVQKHIKDFDAALVKGMGNYVCIDRMETERTGMQFYAKNRDFKRLVDITEDPDSLFNGDFETLDFHLPADIRARISTDSDQCAWSKCNYFGDCYIRQMRERAALAQVIVVNHTLLLLDAAMGGFLLPERDVIILDEAHHLEEEATRSFTITINPSRIQTLLAQRMLKNHSQLSLQDEAFKAAQNTWSRLTSMTNLAYKGRVNLEVPVEEGLRLATVISDLADSLRKQRPKDMPEKEGQLFDKLLKRTQNLSEDIRTVFSLSQPDKFVYYVERTEATGNRSFQLQVSAAPLEISRWLQERLFDKCNVICTSATLATIGVGSSKPEEKGTSFHYFRSRVGLAADERPEVQECILPLTFDYENNALLYLPRDLPEPTFGTGSDDYMRAIAREMYRLVKLSQGRAFLLFSSKRMLDRVYELIAQAFEERNIPYPLLKQGDMTRMELTRRFKAEEGAVLFGLKSFWEGVDIAGDALSLVVIDKLPFDPPDDPVHEARVARMKAAKENWFGNYVLPQAVLRLKQGLGRLLRTRDDRGVMAILDTRLHTKGYGKLVLNALPPAQRTSSVRDVERFFAQ